VSHFAEQTAAENHHQRGRHGTHTPAPAAHGTSSRRRGVFKRIAVVDGDDLLPRLEYLFDHDHLFANLDTGDDVGQVLSRVVSVNAYVGAAPIVEALQEGRTLSLPGAWRTRR